MTKKRISPRPSQPTVPDEARSAAPFVPRTTNPAKLAAAAQTCTGCDLYKNATQAVCQAASKAIGNRCDIHSAAPCVDERGRSG